MNEQQITNSISEQMIDESSEVEAVELNPGSMKEHWIKRNKTKIFLTIIGILGICLIGTIESLIKTEQQLKQKTENLLWLAFEHRAVRNERDFFSKIAEDVNYYKFIKTVYEGKDRDGFFETISIVYEESKRAKVDPWETMSIIHQESGFNPNAVSKIWKTDKDGNMVQVPCAYGLMQVNKNAWEDEKGLTMANILDKRFNVRTGLEIYKHYLRLANGNKFLALFYYNNGTEPTNPNHNYAPAVMNSKFMKMAISYEPIEFEKPKGITQ